VNKAQARRLGGKEPADLLGKTDFDFLPKSMLKWRLNREKPSSMGEMQLSMMMRY
jgi:hypothetical protein